MRLALRAVSLFSSQAAALVSRVSRLRRSTLARACTPLTKSKENEMLCLSAFELYSRWVPLVFCTTYGTSQVSVEGLKSDLCPSLSESCPSYREYSSAGTQLWVSLLERCPSYKGAH